MIAPMHALKTQIETLLYEGAPDFKIAQVLKEDLRTYSRTLEATFAQTGGKDFLVRHTKKIDHLIEWVYRIAVREMFGDFLPPTNAIPIALVALGSYGREQLCVHSDIDLMIVYQDVPGYRHDELIEKILYLLWDTGLKLGHRVHDANELLEVSRTDITIKTALLESRFLIGSRFVWTATQNAIRQIRHDRPEAFIRAKVEELRTLHRRFGLTMEPNLKEGVGGFRDANLVYWIGKLLHDVPRIRELPKPIVDEEDYRAFRIALEFLFRVRSALHLVTGKKEDRLRLDVIPDVARLLRYPDTHAGQMRLARTVTRSLKTVRLYSKIWLEALIGERMGDLYDGLLPAPEKQTTFLQTIRYLNRHADTFFTAHPRLLSALLHAARPERPTPTLYRTIGHIFDRPHAYAVLTTLSSVGLLAYAIAPLRKVIDLPQFDGYHHYTVDLHSLYALRALEEPIDDPLLTQLYRDLDRRQRRLLKIVTLLHDAGKGRKKDHHSVGVSLFGLFGQKLGLSDDEIALGERLIAHHTLMSTTAQREDLYSEKTILAFASRFDTPVALSMIYLLTYADLSGVGGNTWNPRVARLLHILYRESLSVLQRRDALDETARRLKKIDALKRSSAFRTLGTAQQNKILSIPSDAFFIRHSTRRILAIAQAAFATEDLSFYLTNDDALTVEIVRRGNIDIGYLLHALSRLSVAQMEIIKLFDDRKYFKIDFDERVPDDELPRIERIVREAYAPHAAPDLSRPQIERSDIEIDCDHSREYATLRLRTRDQRGLLAYIITRFDHHGIDIASTKIHTVKGRVNDLFLIEKNGNFCHNIDQLILELTE
jgi:[protein-PII] uridylyltransferase